MTRQASFSKETRERADKDKKTMFRIQFNGQYDEHKDSGSAIELTGVADHVLCLRAYEAFLKIINEGKVVVE